MKKIICIVSILFCLVPFCVFAESSEPVSFRYNLTFDSTLDDIIAAEGAEPTFSFGGYVLYQDVKTAGKTSQVLYVMDGDVIGMCSIFIQEKHSEPQTYTFDYNAIDEILIEKYGTPDSPKDVKWFDDLYMNEPHKLGFAVSCGDALVTTRWDLDGLGITHALQGDNYEITHIITYTPASLEEYNSPQLTDHGL